MTTIAPVPTERSSVRRDASMLLAVNIFYRLGGIIFIVVLSRKLALDVIGVFGYCESLADAAIIIASLSLDIVVSRRIAASPEHAASHLAPLLGLRLISAPVYLAVMFAVAWFQRSPANWALPLIAVYTLCESLYFSLAGIFIVLNRVRFNVIIGFTSEAIFLLLIVLGMMFRPALETVIVACMIRMAFLLVAGFVVMRRFIGPMRLVWNVELLRASTPYLLVSVLTLMQGRTEQVLLGWLTDYKVVGQYELAIRLLMAAMFVPQTIASAVFPRVASEGLSQLNRKRFSRALAAVLGIGALGCLIMLFCPPVLLRLLYGPNGDQVIGVVRAMSVALPIRFVGIFLASILAALSADRAVVIGSAAAIVGSVMADIVLIPRFSANGAAWALTVGMLLQTAWLAAAFARLARSGLTSTASKALS